MRLRLVMSAVVVMAAAVACTPDPGGGPPPDPALGCHDSTMSEPFPQPDALYVGPVDTVGNVVIYGTTDGSCGGDPLGLGTATVAASLDDANAWCLDNVPNSIGAFVPADQGYSTMPPGYYGCTVVFVP